MIATIEFVREHFDTLLALLDAARIVALLVVAAAIGKVSADLLAPRGGVS